MVEYSRLIEADEEGTIARQKAHRGELIDPAIAEHDGRLVKTTGDGMLVEFSSVLDAVRCAIMIQQAMAEREAEVPEDRKIRYRIGINLGDIVIDGDDILGDGVNVAARLERLAEPGGICISRKVVHEVRNKLDVGFEFTGEQKVKNIETLVPVYRVRLEPDAAGKMIGERRRARLRWHHGAVAVAALLLVVAGAAWWQPWAPTVAPASVERMTLPLPEDPSVAVLPFDNMSGDVEQGYFADGMTEDLITDLSKVAGLFVISRNSTFVYKGKAVEIRTVAEDLGVRYVVEGSVRRAGNEVRINVQLIDALSGYHVWADRYDGSLADIFSLQDEVVGRIVSALAVSITGISTKTETVGTNIADAYDGFLEGWHYYRRRTPEDTLAAIELFERAVEIDPDYSRAYAGLAASYWLIAESSGWSPKVGILWQEAFDKAKEYLVPALARPTALARQVSAEISGFEGNPAQALEEIDRAIALEPSNADNFVSRARILINTGRFAEAVQDARLAMRMNPHYGPEYLYALGRAQFYLGQYEAAAKTETRITTREPERAQAYMRIAAAFGQLGRLDEAKAAVARYNELMVKTGYTPLTVQEVGLWFEDTLNFSDKSIPEPLFEGLRNAGVPEGAAPERDGFDFKALVSSGHDEQRRIYDVAGGQKIGAEAVKAMLEQGAVVIDVRDAGSFGRGHIPGAINLDLNTALTEERLSALLGKGDPVIFHCWGVSCSYSAMACAKAVLWGYTDVYYFAGGFPAWKAASYPVEKSDDGG
jgi:TolB-like protein/rhodanese-related sulfurtransferase/Flp pilus assembly protein TadD